MTASVTPIARDDAYAVPTNGSLTVNPDHGLDLAWGQLGLGGEDLNYPFGTAVDDSGNIYVADTGNSRIVMFAPDGSYLTEWGSYGTEPGHVPFTARRGG